MKHLNTYKTFESRSKLSSYDPIMIDDDTINDINDMLLDIKEERSISSSCWLTKEEDKSDEDNWGWVNVDLLEPAPSISFMLTPRKKRNGRGTPYAYILKEELEDMLEVIKRIDEYLENSLNIYIHYHTRDKKDYKRSFQKQINVNDIDDLLESAFSEEESGDYLSDVSMTITTD